MPVLSIPEAHMAALCLSWLEARPERSFPMLLYSGGPLRPEARHHILVSEPRVTVEGRVFRDGEGGGRVIVRGPGGALLEERPCDQLLDLLRDWSRRLHDDTRGNPLEPFDQGWVGCLGYDLAWLFEYGLPKFLPSSSALPDLFLGWYEHAVVMDRETGRVLGRDEDLAELEELPAPRPPAGVTVVAHAGRFHREDYEAAVERVVEHCRRGDLFQADMSRRIELQVEGDPRDLFKRLVDKSPAAFSACLALGDGRAVVSSSPEEFLRLHGDRVRTRPIKGTRPRGVEAGEDARLARALLGSGKDLAELTMIVDLMRNDLGRVARPGSVTVEEFPVLMTLPQVHHLFGTVTCELERGKDVFDLCAACFPPGSISGAPKPKAIEILEMVERSRRGIYTGAIGYIEPGRRAHLNVAIRTAEWGGGMLRFGVGGGITVRSDPEAEFEETEDKARGLALALGLPRLG